MSTSSQPHTVEAFTHAQTHTPTHTHPSHVPVFTVTASHTSRANVTRSRPYPTGSESCPRKACALTAQAAITVLLNAPVNRFVSTANSATIPQFAIGNSHQKRKQCSQPQIKETRCAYRSLSTRSMASYAEPSWTLHGATGSRVSIYLVHVLKLRPALVETCRTQTIIGEVMKRDQAYDLEISVTKGECTILVRAA